jgi:hypothetical protein
VHSITDAAAAHSEDMRDRMIKYSMAMGIRMVCIILIFVLDGWLKIVAVAGAVFLPWIAVVIANGSDKAEVHSESLLDYVSAAELDAAAPGTSEEDEAAPTVLEGELIPDEAPGGPATEQPTTGQSSAEQSTAEQSTAGQSSPAKPATPGKQAGEGMGASFGEEFRKNGEERAAS